MIAAARATPTASVSAPTGATTSETPDGVASGFASVLADLISTDTASDRMSADGDAKDSDATATDAATVEVTTPATQGTDAVVTDHDLVDQSTAEETDVRPTAIDTPPIPRAIASALSAWTAGGARPNSTSPVDTASPVDGTAASTDASAVGYPAVLDGAGADNAVLDSAALAALHPTRAADANAVSPAAQAGESTTPVATPSVVGILGAIGTASAEVTGSGAAAVPATAPIDADAIAEPPTSSRTVPDALEIRVLDASRASGGSEASASPVLLPSQIPVSGASAVSAPVVSAPATTAASSPTPASVLTTQVAGPLFRLATAHGDHVMTLTVTPEDLGPVVVRAHVSAEGMRVELFAATDAGRDALRSILPDLRRDLAGGGVSAGLDLSDHDGPTARDQRNSDSADRRDTRGANPASSARSEQATRAAARVGWASTSTIDLFA